MLVALTRGGVLIKTDRYGTRLKDLGNQNVIKVKGYATRQETELPYLEQKSKRNSVA
jgi:hypothetical protein